MCSMVIFASGCTLPGGGSVSAPWESDDTGNNGLVVKDFYASPSLIGSDESVELKLLIENVGDSDATAVKATLYSPPIAVGGWENNDTKLEKDSLPIDLRCPKRDLNIRGNIGYIIWNLQSPILEEYEKRSYIAGAEISYMYTTKANADISVLDKHDLIEMEEKGMDVSYSSINTYCSNAPIKIDIKTTEPILMTKPDSTFLLRIVVENIGDGSVYSKDDIINNVNLTISLPGLEIKDTDGVCSFLKSGSADIKLMRGTFDIMCEVGVESKSSKGEDDSIEGGGIYKILVKSEYKYVIKTSTNLETIGI